MRILLWLLALFALAVGVSMAFGYNEGYVLVVLPPWRVELSLNLFVVLAVGGFLLGHFLLRVVSHTLRLPQAVRAFRERKRRERAARALREAVQQLFEGRYGHALKNAAVSHAAGEAPALSALVAARAAHFLRDERRDEARALIDHCRAVGAVAQARLACFGEPGLDGAQQRVRLLARRHERRCNARRPGGGRLDQQHAVGADQFGDLLDQELVQRGAVTQFVQPPPGVDEPAKRLGKPAADREVREPRRARQPMALRGIEPGKDDLAVRGDLVEVAAAQPRVVQVSHAGDEQRVRALQRVPRGGLAPVGGERARVPPPDVGTVAERCAAESLRAMAARRSRGRAQRSGGVARGEVHAREREPDRASIRAAGQAAAIERGLQACRGVGLLSGRQRELAREQRAERLDERIVEGRRQRLERRPDAARAIDVAACDQPLDGGALRQRLSLARADALAGVDRLLIDRDRAAVQPEFGVGIGEVAEHHGAAEQPAAAIEGLQSALHQFEALRHVLRAEAQHVEGIAQTEAVCAALREIDRTLRRFARRRRVRVPRKRQRLDPVRAALADDVALGTEALDRCARAAQRRQGARRAHFDLAQQQQAAAEARAVAGPAREPDRRRRRGARLGQPAAPHQCLRLAAKRRRLGRRIVECVRDAAHRVGVGGGVGDAAFGVERIGAHFEQRKPQRRRKPGRSERAAR